MHKVLECIGNARTAINSNSSRFISHLLLKYTKMGVVIAGNQGNEYTSAGYSII